MVASIIEKERPDALLPTLGGQTALNCALDLAREGVLDKFDVELIGASKQGHRQGGGPREVQGGDDSHRARLGRVRASRTTSSEALEVQADIGFPAVLRPSFTLGGTGGGIAYNRDEFIDLCKRGLDLSPTSRDPDRGIAARLERVRDGGHARPSRTTASSSARSRTSIRWACTPATRSPSRPAQTLTDKEYQIMRDASIAVLREVGVDTGGSNIQFAVNPARRPHDRHRDEPARVAFLGARVEGDRLSDRQDRREARRRLHARRAEERHHRRADARVASSRRSTTSSPRSRASRSRSSRRPTDG